MGRKINQGLLVSHPSPSACQGSGWGLGLWVGGLWGQGKAPPETQGLWGTMPGGWAGEKGASSPVQGTLPPEGKTSHPSQASQWQPQHCDFLAVQPPQPCWAPASSTVTEILCS